MGSFSSTSLAGKDIIIRNEHDFTFQPDRWEYVDFKSQNIQDRF